MQAKHPARLSKTFVERVAHAGRYGDSRAGFGLSLLVKPRAAGVGWSKTWSQRLEIDGKRVLFGLGAYPVVTLEEARARALDNKRAVMSGKHPGRVRASMPTFRDAALAALKEVGKKWRSERAGGIWLASLETYVFPALGKRPVNDIVAADIVAVLRAPALADKPATAGKVQQRIAAVFANAVLVGNRTDNPATGTAKAVSKAKTTNHKAVPFAKVAAALDAVRSSDAWDGTKDALEFLTLTATRSGEVRGAVWSEVDLEAKTWTIPAGRMKTDTEHRVPLSRQALELVQDARRYSGPDGLIFPAVRGGLARDATLSRLLAALEVEGTVHGMRSSFRDWAAENGHDRQLAEAALAHTVGGVEGAYFRSDLFLLRREIMQSWADFLAG